MSRWLRLAGLARHLGRLWSATKAMWGTTVLPPRRHALLACRWLQQAQRVGGGGFAHSFDLGRGWLPPYPETTGYLIPTLLDAAAVLRRPHLAEAARQAGEWLLARQLGDGGFPDLQGKAQVFDTGQILYGLLALDQATGDVRWQDAAARAATFLLARQDDDGAWRRDAFQGIAHTYYTRVAAALLRAGQRGHRPDWIAAAQRQLDWACSRQNGDGYFADMAFAEAEAPYLHTIIYVLEGLEDAYRACGAAQYRAAVVNGVQALLRVAGERDFILRSQYAPGWHCANPEKCMTGLAQWAGLLGRLARDPAFCRDELDPPALQAEADKTLHWLLAKQLLRAPKGLQGAWTGSLPPWGRYTRFACNNWTVKFVLDALLPRIAADVDGIDLESAYIGSAFRFQAQRHYVPEQVHLEPAYVAFVGNAMAGRDRGHLVDIGCGHGHLLRHLLLLHPDWSGTGVEPSFIPTAQQGPVIVAGDAYRTSLPAQCADLILLKEVLQHVGHFDRALLEVRRIARPGARLLIIERDLGNVFGLLKPLREQFGRWMYPWDTSFRERWYSRRQWHWQLAPYGRIERIQAINPRYPGAPWRRLHFGFLLIEVALADFPPADHGQA